MLLQHVQSFPKRSNWRAAFKRTSNMRCKRIGRGTLYGLTCLGLLMRLDECICGVFV